MANARRLLDQYKKLLWNKPVAQLGLGTVLNSIDNTWEGMDDEQVTLFIGCALPVSSFGQGILNFQSSFFHQDSAKYKYDLKMGGRLLAGNSDFRGSIEALYHLAFKKNANSDLKRLRTTAGFELKISQGIWLELAVGADNVLEKDDKTSFLSLFNFKYAFQKARRFEMGG